LNRCAAKGRFQVAEKVEVQEALPPAGVLGAEPLSLMLQHFPREPAKRCFQAMAANQVFFVSQVFSTVWVFCPVAPDETAPLRLLLNPAVERERRKHAQGVLQAVKKVRLAESFSAETLMECFRRSRKLRPLTKSLASKRHP